MSPFTMGSFLGTPQHTSPFVSLTTSEVYAYPRAITGVPDSVKKEPSDWHRQGSSKLEEGPSNPEASSARETWVMADG